MMALRKPYFWLLVLLMLVCAAGAAAWDNPLLLVLPIGAAGFLFLGTRPLLVFYLLLITIPWSIEFQLSARLGTDLPDEPLMLLTCLSGIAVSLFFRKRRLFRGIVSPLCVLLLVQFTWAIITVATSEEPLLSIKFLLAKMWYLGAFVVVPYILFQSRTHLYTAAKLLTVSMLALTMLTLVRHAANGLTFSTINNSLLPFFRNHVNYSALLVCVIPLTFVFRKQSASGWPKRLWTIALVCSLAALYLSYARGAWLALVVGAGAYFLLQRKWLFSLYLVVLSVVATGSYWLVKDNHYMRFAHDFRTTIFHTNFNEHLVATYQFKDVSTAERFYRWIAGARMVKDRPVTGFGPSTFNRHYKPYGVPAFRTWVSDNEEQSTIHNYFLLTLIEQGIPGLIILVILTGYFFYRGQQLYAVHKDPFWRAAIMLSVIIFSMLCTVNFLSDLVETDKLGGLYYLCITVLMVADYKWKKPLDPGTHLEGIS
jgi:O-antigen ligase